MLPTNIENSGRSFFAFITKPSLGILTIKGIFDGVIPEAGRGALTFSPSSAIDGVKPTVEGVKPTVDGVPLITGSGVLVSSNDFV